MSITPLTIVVVFDVFLCRVKLGYTYRMETLFDILHTALYTKMTPSTPKLGVRRDRAVGKHLAKVPTTTEYKHRPQSRYSSTLLKKSD